MREDDCEKIYSKLLYITETLEEVKEQATKTNGRVTKLEKHLLLVAGLLIGAGVVNWKAVSQLFQF